MKEHCIWHWMFQWDLIPCSPIDEPFQDDCVATQGTFSPSLDPQMTTSQVDLLDMLAYVPKIPPGMGIGLGTYL